mgnify:CR=1 FL=1
MKRCSVDDCDAPHRARGLCAKHWNERYRKDQHREVPCAVCGKAVVKNGPGVKRRAVCSDRCRYHLTFGHDISEHRELVGPVPKRPATPAPPQEAVIGRKWTGGSCAWCDKTFVGPLGSAYCSRKCARKWHKVQRRARERGAAGTYTWSEVVRIYLAIGGCAYCGQPTTDVQPDHVIPLSRGGSNSITNVVPCCRPCNTDKRALLPNEWIADRIRRGVQPLYLDPRLIHLTDARLAV